MQRDSRMTTVMPRMETSRLVMRRDLAELTRLASWIECWAGESVPPDTAFALQLCLEEAVANIIMHGTASEDRAEIAVELERDGKALRARVEDCGQKFDPTQFPLPVPATSLETAKVGDLGIHLMRSFATGMRYERRDHRNRSTFLFLGSRAAAARF
jgi:serine/threonine-protein kinase RsbW